MTDNERDEILETLLELVTYDRGPKNKAAIRKCKQILSEIQERREITGDKKPSRFDIQFPSDKL